MHVVYGALVCMMLVGALYAQCVWRTCMHDVCRTCMHDVCGGLVYMMCVGVLYV